MRDARSTQKEKRINEKQKKRIKRTKQTKRIKKEKRREKTIEKSNPLSQRF